jgi:hypothetical protein
MSINPLFETALGRARPISFEMDLARARRIMSLWTSLKRLSSDEAEIIVRMIAQGIAEDVDTAGRWQPNSPLTIAKT